MVGPEYISMAAAEAARPRRVMKKAYASYPWRLVTFFILGALSMGILIPYNDPTLAATLEGTKRGSGTGAASPYVISMNHFNIRVLPDIVNALIMTSVFSAGNNLVFSAARTLHGMALEGRAPTLFARCNRNGLPYYAVAASLAFCLLGFLQVSNNSSTVLNWLVGIIVASYLLNYVGTCITYLHFYAALRRQGISRDTLPYKGYLQPYAGWFALVGTIVMTLIIGFEIFIDGQWDVQTFFLDYTMVGFFVVAYGFWKVVKRTRYVWPGTADLGLGGLKKEIDEYEAGVVVPVRKGVRGFWNGLYE
ncbi:hypothetical protein AnigIFM63309_008491 [Aspergillus niger]|nr:hypothetical protein AnigIFM63309_008491 [Aspergillus niger]